MGSLRNVVVIFVLVAVLAVTISHADHQSSLQKHRIRRQAAEEATPKEVAQENPEPDQAAEDNPPPEAGQEDQAPEDEDQDEAEGNTLIDLGIPFLTPCNHTVDPIKSCYDCSRLLICKRFGGLVKRCGSPFRPHCVNGTCRATPSAECA
ncbi:hypothetical protein NE865_05870 [Phthorimaea operculella]|nr:hypothetical protein NE865_05870 [Phthorimaea operculella]